MDFLKAIAGHMPTWAASYQIYQKRAITDGSLTFRELGNDFRQGLAIHQQPKGKIGKGAFTTYAEKPEKAQNGENGDARIIKDHIPSHVSAIKSRKGRGERAFSRVKP